MPNCNNSNNSNNNRNRPIQSLPWKLNPITELSLTWRFPSSRRSFRFWAEPEPATRASEEPPCLRSLLPNPDSTVRRRCSRSRRPPNTLSSLKTDWLRPRTLLPRPSISPILIPSSPRSPATPTLNSPLPRRLPRLRLFRSRISLRSPPRESLLFLRLRWRGSAALRIWVLPSVGVPLADAIAQRRGRYMSISHFFSSILKDCLKKKKNLFLWCLVLMHYFLDWCDAAEKWGWRGWWGYPQ